MTLYAADLFCGAGGTSTGLIQACKSLDRDVELVAVNHWPKAISTHELNHPSVTHFCASIDTLDPLRAVPGGKLDLLVAGVECTHHSRARGGKPMSDQRRSSAWHVVNWAEKLRVKEILVENVSEFEKWGPLDDLGRPIKEREGDTFRAFVGALESLGYAVDHRVLTCADYGDPTTRRRLFLRASREGRISWPARTHSADNDNLRPWRTAREIIDWADLGTSIFKRKRPLAKRTVERIRAGISRFCGELAQPFLLLLTHGGRLFSIDKPLPTVTCAKRGEFAVVNPFLVRYFGQSAAEGIDGPLSTVTAENKHALISPLLLPHDQFVAKNGLGLVDSVDQPLRTITASNGGDQYLVSPFLVPHFGERQGQEPRTHSLDEPLPTVTATKGSGSLVTPFVIPNYRTGSPRSVEEPLGTVTTRDRFALVTPEGHALDIFFRMLKPSELSAAQGFPATYRFAGNKGEVVRQIGNAVPVSTSAALCREILREAA